MPSYLSFKDRANKSAAQANVRAVLPDVESYNADNTVGNTTNDPDAATDTTHSNSGYQGMTAALLKSDYDQAFPPSVWIIGAGGRNRCRGSDRHGDHRPRHDADRDRLLPRGPERQLLRLEARAWRHDQGRHRQEQHLHLIASTPEHVRPRGRASAPSLVGGQESPIRG